MGKPIGFKGLNTRYRRLVNEFGTDSAIVQAAQKFIEYRISKDHLVYGKDEKGNTVLTGISQSKKTEEALGDHKWTSYDEWVPKIHDVYAREKELLKDMEPYKMKDGMLGPDAPIDPTLSVRKMLGDPFMSSYLKSKAEFTAGLLKDNGDIINNVYEAAKDSEFTRQSEAIRMRDELKDKAYLAYDLQWLNEANDLVNAWYLELASRAIDEDNW